LVKHLAQGYNLFLLFQSTPGLDSGLKAGGYGFLGCSFWPSRNPHRGGKLIGCRPKKLRKIPQFPHMNIGEDWVQTI
jgi:hypothetical protein